MVLEAGFLPGLVGVLGSLGALPAAGEGAMFLEGVGVVDRPKDLSEVGEVGGLLLRALLVLLAEGEMRLGVGGKD